MKNAESALTYNANVFQMRFPYWSFLHNRKSHDCHMSAHAMLRRARWLLVRRAQQPTYLVKYQYSV